MSQKKSKKKKKVCDQLQSDAKVSVPFSLCTHTHTYFSITEGVDGPRGRGVGGASVGLLSAHFLWFRYWFHHLRFDCLSAVIVHWLCEQERI